MLHLGGQISHPFSPKKMFLAMHCSCISILQLYKEHPPTIQGSPQRIFSRQNSVEILFEAQRFYLGLEWSWSHVVRNAIITLKFTNLNLTLESFSNKHGGCLLMLVIIFHLKWVEVKSPHLPSVHIILSIFFHFGFMYDFTNHGWTARINTSNSSKEG